MARIQMNPAQAALPGGCHPSIPTPAEPLMFLGRSVCLPWARGFCLWPELRCWGFLFTRAAVPAVGGSSALAKTSPVPKHPRCQNIAGALSGSGVQNPNQQKAFNVGSSSSDPLVEATCA